MPTLILSPRYTSDSITLWKAAISVGWEVERLQTWKPPEWLCDRDLVLYGEPLFCAAIAEALSLVLLEPSLSWLADLPSVYCHRQVRLTTLKDARAQAESAFIKPAYGKHFPAKVYESRSQLPSPEILPGSFPVIISEPVEWEVEFRCFVLHREVTTISPYLRYANLAQESDGSWPASQSEIEQALEFCTALLKNNAVSLPPAVVVDVGKIVGKGWAIVEANQAWASGIYGCDPTLVLPVIQRTCVKRNLLTENEKRWVLEGTIEGV